MLKRTLECVNEVKERMEEELRRYKIFDYCRGNTSDVLKTMYRIVKGVNEVKEVISEELRGYETRNSQKSSEEFDVVVESTKRALVGIDAAKRIMDEELEVNTKSRKEYGIAVEAIRRALRRIYKVKEFIEEELEKSLESGEKKVNIEDEFISDVSKGMGKVSADEVLREHITPDRASKRSSVRGR